VAYIRIVLIFRRSEDQREGTTVFEYVSELSSNTSTKITTRRGMVLMAILYPVHTLAARDPERP